MAQGIPRDKDQIVEALKPYFQLGYSVYKACILAKIPRTTVETWLLNDDDLRAKIEAWQNMVNAEARRNVVNAIVKDKSKEDSKWWLEKRDKEFLNKQATVEVTMTDDESGELDGRIQEHINAMYGEDESTTEETSTDNDQGTESEQETEA